MLYCICVCLQIVNKGDKPAYSVLFKEKPAVFDTAEIATIILQKMMGYN